MKRLLALTFLAGSQASQAAPVLAPSRLEALRLTPESLAEVSPAQLDLVAGTWAYTAAGAAPKQRSTTLGFARQASPSLWYRLPLAYSKVTDAQTRAQLQLTPAAAYKIMDSLVLGAGYEQRFNANAEATGASKATTTTLGLRYKRERFDLGISGQVHDTTSADSPKSDGPAVHGRILVLPNLAVGALYEGRMRDHDRKALYAQARFGAYLVQTLAGVKEAALVLDRSFDASELPAASSVGLAVERQRDVHGIGARLRLTIALR